MITKKMFFLNKFFNKKLNLKGYSKRINKLST